MATNIIIKYTEEQDPNESADSFDLKNEIKLAKRYKVDDDPKLMMKSVEHLIGRFCDEHEHLNGKAQDLVLVTEKRGVLERGALMGQYVD